MSKRFEENRKFKENLGGFIIAFSELEYALAELSALSDEDLPKWKYKLVKHLGHSLDEKLKHISKFIDSELPELKSIWDEQKQKVKLINQDRRYLAHGFTQYFIPFDDGIVPAYTRQKIGKDSYKIEKKNFTSQTLFELTDKIHHLKSGKNGLYGEFNFEFMRLRVNKWNLQVTDEKKIVHKINGKIVSEWKG
jgi:hypothetical protein